MTGWAVNSNMSLRDPHCTVCVPGADMVIKVALRLQGFTDEDSMEEQFSPFVRFLKGLTWILSTMSLSKREIRRDGLMGLLVKTTGQIALDIRTWLSKTIFVSFILKTKIVLPIEHSGLLGLDSAVLPIVPNQPCFEVFKEPCL